MNPSTGSSGAPTPPPASDPGQTQYFPPQGGAYTQQPANQPAPGSYISSIGRNDRDRTILALVLIGGGLLFLLDQFSFFPDIGGYILLLIGGVFMYAYFNTRPGYRIGFLIPGAILLGIGVGEALIELPFASRFWPDGDLTTVTLGLGFCLIWLMERKHWWALIPGGILVLSGLGSMDYVGNLWPLALIVLGVYLLYDQSRRKQAH